jgi:hypothetical protein
MSVPRKLIYYLVVAGASDFPHSRQDGWDRDVISPQNGHILCGAKPRSGGVSDADSFEMDAWMAASRLRKRSRNRRKARSISDPPSFFLPMHEWFAIGRLGRSALEEVFLSSSLHLCPTDDDTTGLVILCKIAHTCTKSVGPAWREPGNLLDEPTKVSNLDHLSSCALSDHDV